MKSSEKTDTSETTPAILVKRERLYVDGTLTCTMTSASCLRRQAQSVPEL
jgi:hypothetical protein